MSVTLVAASAMGGGGGSFSEEGIVGDAEGLHDDLAAELSDINEKPVFRSRVSSYHLSKTFLTSFCF